MEKGAALAGPGNIPKAKMNITDANNPVRIAVFLFIIFFQATAKPATILLLEKTLALFIEISSEFLGIVHGSTKKIF
jgi:hypothetical protein